MNPLYSKTGEAVARLAVSTEQTAPYPILVQEEQNTSSLSASQYTPYIKDLFRPKPVVYWVDFMLSNLVGNLCIYLAVKLDSFSVTQILCVLMAAIALYRALLFVHEALHLGRQLKGFSVAYNLIAGFLHKFPSYTYQPHFDHHSERKYGTIEDPEYEALADKPAFTLLVPALSMFLVPALLVVRYGFLPLILPFIGKRGRLVVYIHASTFMMNLKYRRRPPTAKDVKSWYVQDTACAVYNGLFIAFMSAEWMPWKTIWVWYSVMYVLYALNFYRVIVSHRYLTGLQPATQKQQILDSTILTSRLDEWWCPVGLRYHALHHMYPSIPYHNLGKAHARLMQHLPEDHPYRRTVIHGYFSALRRLIWSSQRGVSGTGVQDIRDRHTAKTSHLEAPSVWHANA